MFEIVQWLILIDLCGILFIVFSFPKSKRNRKGNIEIGVIHEPLYRIGQAGTGCLPDYRQCL